MSVDTERPVDRGEGHTQVPAGQKDRRVAQPPKLRRRPALVAASIAAVCLGGLLGAFAWTATSDTRSVVAVRSAVERGAVIGREDLMAVQVGLDPALTPIPAAQVETLVGQRAAVDMAAGTLVTREQISAHGAAPAGVLGRRGGVAGVTAAGGTAGDGRPDPGGRHPRRWR